jgi:hypothetical protein
VTVAVSPNPAQHERDKVIDALVAFQDKFPTFMREIVRGGRTPDRVAVSRYFYREVTDLMITYMNWVNAEEWGDHDLQDYHIKDRVWEVLDEIEHTYTRRIEMQDEPECWR